MIGEFTIFFSLKKPVIFDLQLKVFVFPCLWTDVFVGFIDRLEF